MYVAGVTVLALRTGSPALLRYKAQESSQTLAEGLAEYYAYNGARVTPPASLPPASAALLRNHDICHVIFGLDTTLSDEALADTRTMLSCDVGWSVYLRYLSSDPRAKEVRAELGFWRGVWAALAALPRIARALLEAARMRRRWPWSPPADHFDTPLAALRARYGIRVI